MLHNVVLVSAVQQGESAVSVHISRPSKFIILEVRFFSSSSATRYGDVFFFFLPPSLYYQTPNSGLTRVAQKRSYQST